MTQKELKAMYTEELKKAWNDEKMVKYCSKQLAYVVEHKGCLYEIEKPRIKTSFCFGYGLYSISNEEDEKRAFDMADIARKNEQYFIDENLKQIDSWIKELNEILEDMQLNWCEGSHPQYMVTTGRRYIGQTLDCKLRNFSIENTFRGNCNGVICEDIELVKKLIGAFEEVKKDFIKRLNTYLKRYGLSKVKTWTYLVD